MMWCFSADVGATYVRQYNDVTKFYQTVLAAGVSVNNDHI